MSKQKPKPKQNPKPKVKIPTSKRNKPLSTRRQTKSQVKSQVKPQLKPPTKPTPRATKRLTLTGRYYFYDIKSGRRISKADYYVRLKTYHNRIKTYQEKTKVYHKRSKKPSHRKSRQRSKVEKSSYEGKYARGFNYDRACRIWIEEYGTQVDAIIDKVRDYYDDCRRRFKFLSFCYINLRGKVYLSTGETEVIHVNTRISFPSQYDDSAFFFEQVRTALESFLIMFEDSTHSGEFEELAEKILLTMLSVHTREDKSFEKER